MKRPSPFLIAAWVTLYGLAGGRPEDVEPEPRRRWPRIFFGKSRRYHPPKHGRLGYRALEVNLRDWPEWVRERLRWERDLRSNIRGITGSTFQPGVTSGVTQLVAGTNTTLNPSSGKGVVTVSSTAGSFVPVAGPSSQGLTYVLFYDGTHWNFVNQNTGNTDANPTTQATAIAQLATYLNSSTGNKPTVIIVSAEVSLTGTPLQIYGYGWSITTQNVNGAFAGQKPYIQQIQMGVSGETTNSINGCLISNLAVGELDIFGYCPQTAYNIFQNMTVLNEGGTGQCGIVLDTSVGSGYIDYAYFVGVTMFNHGNGTAMGGSYPGGCVTFKGPVNTGTDQIRFAHIMMLNNGSLTNNQNIYIFHWISNTAYTTYNGRIQCDCVEVNWNTAATGIAASIVGFDCGATTTTTNLGIYITQLSVENHILTGGMGNTPSCSLYYFNSTGTVTTSLVIHSLLNSYSQDVALTFFQDLGPSTHAAQRPLKMLHITEIEVVAAGLGIGWGTMVESFSWPVFIGDTSMNASYIPDGIATGSIVATPIATGNLLSINGTSAAWAASTTYTCLQNRLLFTVLTAGTTVTITTVTRSGGTTILSAVTPTVGMTFTLFPGNTLTFNAFGAAPTFAVQKAN